MTKELRKANMKRTWLKNSFNKTRTNENWAAYKRQRNLCVKILRQNKKSYYAQLDPKVVSDNKRFWKTVKPLFSNKIQSSSCITLLENGVVESDEGKVAEILNNYFVNITETLGIASEHEQKSLNDHEDDPCKTFSVTSQCPQDKVVRQEHHKLLLQEDHSRRNARTVAKFRS